MKTLEQVKQSYTSQSLDGRDISRLSQFIPEDQLKYFGIKLKPEFVGKHLSIEWNRENVLKQLQKDVAFGFEKALDKRGISASLMNDVVKMWNWILEEGLENFDEYAQYGLPTLKETALKYGFDNPIGSDEGNEFKYSADGDNDY